MKYKLSPSCIKCKSYPPVMNTNRLLSNSFNCQQNINISQHNLLTLWQLSIYEKIKHNIRLHDSISDQITDEITDQNYKYSMLISKNQGCWYPLFLIFRLFLIFSRRFNSWSFSISNLFIEYLLDWSSEKQKL